MFVEVRQIPVDNWEQLHLEQTVEPFAQEQCAGDAGRDEPGLQDRSVRDVGLGTGIFGREEFSGGGF